MKFKKIAITTGVFIVSLSAIQAQNFKFGLVGGVNLANIRIENTSTLNIPAANSELVSYNVNAHVGYKSAGMMGFSIEPGFIQKGGINKNDIEDIKTQLNYIHMPILADIYFSEKFFFSIGPEIGYMIDANTKSGSTSLNLSNYDDDKVELSGLVGINYNLLKNIDLSARYSRGLTSISKSNWVNSNGESIGQTKEYNQYFQFLVRFYIFNGSES